MKLKKILYILIGLALVAMGLTITVYGFMALTNFKMVEDIAHKLFYMLGKTDASTEYKPVLIITEILVGVVLSRGLIGTFAGIYSFFVAFYNEEKFELQKLLVITVAILTLLLANVIVGLLFVILVFIPFKNNSKMQPAVAGESSEAPKVEENSVSSKDASAAESSDDEKEAEVAETENNESSEDCNSEETINE